MNRLCSIEGCGKPHLARGFCSRHYEQRRAQFSVRPCSVEGCGHGQKGHGYCKSHYARFKRHGHPLGGNAPWGAGLAFMENLCRSTPPADECILWPFARSGRGYGSLSLNGVICNVHREVCLRVHGDPPSSDHEAAHSCGIRACVNPRHLRWATASENQMDRVIHGTSNRGERSASAKLTEDDVREIRALKGVLGNKRAAKKFGVTPGHISMIRNRTKWGHVA